MLHAINERRCDPPLYSHEVDGITARAADWDAGEFELGPERGELERELMEARRRLEEERTAHSEMMAVLRNPNIKTERGTAIAAVLELNHKVAKGETVTLPGRGGGWVRMPTARIAEQAGIAKPQNAAGHVKRLAEWGVFDRTIETKQATEIDAETGEVTSSHVMRELYLRPRQSLPDTLAMLATLDPADPLTKGGNRHGGERLICPDHPDAGTVKRWTLHCQECDRQLDSGDEYHRPTPETPYTQVGSTKQEASAGAFLYTQLGSTEDAPDPLPRPTIANHPENAL